MYRWIEHLTLSCADFFRVFIMVFIVAQSDGVADLDAFYTDNQ
jgi:hypothetical protein